VASGCGGDGRASFRREKHVLYGGPDGGDGGRGGDVILEGDEGRNTLIELRGHAIWRARSGEAGGTSRKTGASADPVLIRVPVGTKVFDQATGLEVGDVTGHGQHLIVAKGGAPGVGNVHYKSSRNRAPRKFTLGKPGEEHRLRLELMLMADVGLLGFPNAGKSTLIRNVSAARPKVGDYPFTTQVPSLGVVKIGMDSFVMADIPGLIEGAAQGAGMGHQFLRHVKRTRILLHLLSLGPDEPRTPAERYTAIRGELAAFDPRLAQRDEIIALTKTDLVDADEIAEALAGVAAAAGRDPEQIHRISAPTQHGTKALLQEIQRRLATIAAAEASEE
jgi:GTP-binding protein